MNLLTKTIEVHATVTCSTRYCGSKLQKMSLVFNIK